MLAPVLLSLAGLVLLIALVIIGYAIWVVHKTTSVERVSVSGHPSMLGLTWEDVTFSSRGDEVILSGWYLPVEADDRCVILIQGTGDHRNSPQIRALRLGRDLVENGFSVLLFDFRARGESEGSRSSEGDREQWDLLGAIDYVTDRGIPVERIGLLGFSLGAGVALLVAAQEPRIPAVVSDSGFLDYMMDLQFFRIGPFHFPAWFARLIAFIGRIFFNADFSKVRPIEVIEQVEQPVFFIHGENDVVVSAEESKELYNISNNPEDRIWIVPNTEHVNIYRKMSKVYVNRVTQFFQRYIK
ncbi:alpha/beta hydrolase [Chloroflexota bacterium]